MKRIALLCWLAITVVPVRATLSSTHWSDAFANDGVVPDNNYSGWSDTREVSTMPPGLLTSVAVELTLEGGWNGDLYAYLVNGSGFCVLLDQVGTSPYGYGDAGMNVVLADTGANTLSGVATGRNINQYQSVLGGPGVPTGVWNPDNTSGNLASFLSGSPNDTWTLFVADLSGGGVTTVQSWGLQMDIVAVPEIETWLAAALAGAFGAFWVNRQIWGPAGERST